VYSVKTPGVGGVGLMPGGRPPKPTALKLLQGTFRKDRARKREPRPKVGDRPPSAPSYLGKIARAEWTRLAKRLHVLGLLTEVDRSKFAMYCQAYARWQEAEQVITDQGMTFMTDKGYVCQRPEVSISNKQCEIARKIGAEFGLDPAARSRIDVDVPEREKPKDAAPSKRERFFGKGA
jgi:P27 family predicted phage terminase small subunit